MKPHPNWDHAIVPETKLTDYLLSETHPDGKSKAKFFLRHGYTAATLERDLKKAARTGSIVEEEDNPHGTKFALVSKLVSPVGTPIRVRSIWVLEPDEVAPRLVTAYPAKR